MVPTRYGRQAILDEFGGLRMCSTSASIDSNRVAERKVCCFCIMPVGILQYLDACVSYKSGRRSVFLSAIESFNR